MAAFLVDTNVLAFALCRWGSDVGDSPRARRARACIRCLGEARNGAVSAQVLGEFFVVATCRLDPPLSPTLAETIAMNIRRAWPVYDVTKFTRHGSDPGRFSVSIPVLGCPDLGNRKATRCAEGADRRPSCSQAR